MADEVEVKLPIGEWVVRTSDNISKEELNYPMRCCGKDKKGRSCHCPMIPVRKNIPYKHIEFRQENDEVVHILGCEHDKRRSKVIVSHLDYRAPDNKAEDIWNAMSKKQGIKGKGKKKQGGSEEGGDGGDDRGGRSDPEPRPILRKSKLPSSPELLAAVLLDLPVDALYANTYVRNLIIDQRTVDRFREEGISQDAYVLVLAKRLAPVNRTFVVNKGEIVLVDCKYDASIEAAPLGCMQFRLSLHGEAKTRMFEYLKLKGDNTYIAIFSRWKRDPDNVNTYFAIDADIDHIDRIRLPDLN